MRQSQALKNYIRKKNSEERVPNKYVTDDTAPDEPQIGPSMIQR